MHRVIGEIARSCREATRNQAIIAYVENKVQLQPREWINVNKKEISLNLGYSLTDNQISSILKKHYFPLVRMVVNSHGRVWIAKTPGFKWPKSTEYL